jgi:exodeoxyribonuclease VII large subunit
MQVYVRAQVTLYEARGDYQLNVDYMEPAGLGNLQLQFEQLKQKLATEGLFSAERKRPLPTRPLKVGVVTSPTGAAIRDVLTVMKRRSPMTEVIIYPCQVQGKQAHFTIIEALKTANRRKEVDVLLLTRGGGSLEDLWCFNEEALAYTIAQSELPVISAVGHEVDFTISDFVADHRAATPSAGAEILTQDQQQLRQQLDSIEIYLHQSLNRRLDQWQSRLSLLTIRLTDPEPLLANYQSDLRHFAQSLSAQLNQLLNQKAHLLQEARLTLQQQHPENRLLRVESHYQTLKQRLQRATQILLKDKQQLLATTAQQLHLVSPLATLERGYSITLKDLTLVRSTDQLRIGDTLTTRLSNGEVISEVIQIES